jgi:hypothetical protein
LATLTAKSQVPRWISAIVPSNSPTKSLSSQPALLVLAGASCGMGTMLSATALSGASSGRPPVDSE